MFKKGLVTLVCLTVMSALWAWATTTYSISTKINSLGTVKVGTRVVNGVTFDRFTTVIGGTIKVRNVTLNKDINAQDRSIKYSQLLSSDSAEVVVSPKPGYKIATLTKTGTGVGSVAVSDNQTTDVVVPVTSPNPLATQYIVATFAPEATTATVTKNWQLQVMNNTLGGTIKVVRAAAIDNYSVVGKALVKSYIDTTPVNVTVTPNDGYSVAYVILDGAKVFANPFATAVNVAPSGSSRLKTIVVGYKKNAIRVTTHVPAQITTDAVTGGIKYADNGILPANPAADPTGAVRLVVTPTGSNNVVKSFGVTAGTFSGSISYADRFGAKIEALPFTGPVKVTISGITGPITVGATYGLDAKNTAAYTNCTQTCHADTKLVADSVRAAETAWLGSAHRTLNVDCVTCHATMPGNIVAGSVDPTTFNVTDAKAGAVGSNYCSKCHAASVNKVLASAHYTKPSGALVCTDCHAAGHNLAGNREACANCHTYVNEHTAENTAGKGCVECHDKHNPATITGTLGTPSAHPAVTLYTFEEIGMQMAGGAKVPVQVDANGKGMPYSPKQTCGTSGCHVKGGVDYTYDKISDHAFHSNEGRSEYQDSATGKYDATKNKPWVQSAAMVGKW
jgi:hypothetical protein